MPAIHWLALLALCAAYLQGGYNKASDFASAVAEMQHFSLQPAAPLAAATIAMELGAALLILSGYWRWLGALALAAFTLAATLPGEPLLGSLAAGALRPGERFL